MTEDQLADARSLLIDAARVIKVTDTTLFTQILDFLYDRDTWAEDVVNHETDMGFAEWQIYQYEQNN